MRACARVFEPAGRDTYRCAHWLSSECVCASAGERTFWPEGQLIRKKVPAAAVVGVTRRRSRSLRARTLLYYIYYILLLWYLPFSEMFLLLLYLLFVIVIMLLGIRASPPSSPSDLYAFDYFFFCRSIVDTSTLFVGRYGRQTYPRYDESFNNEFKIRGILFQRSYSASRKEYSIFK